MDRSADAEGATGARPLILVVEDEDAVRGLVVRQLQVLGYRVEQSGDPRTVLDLVRERALKPDLLLTDVVMPGMNGVQLYRLLETEGVCNNVLYMSGYPGHELSRQESGLDRTRLMSKPFTFAELRDRVAAVLDT